MDDPQQMGVGLAAFGRAALDAGQPELAARWLGAADALRERAGRQQMENYHQFEQSTALARARLDPGAVRRRLAGGRRACPGRRLGRDRGRRVGPVLLRRPDGPDQPDAAGGGNSCGSCRRPDQPRDRRGALHLSVRTVERHMAGLFATLDVHSRADAVEAARAAGACLPATAAEAAADGLRPSLTRAARLVSCSRTGYVQPHSDWVGSPLETGYRYR